MSAHAQPPSHAVSSSKAGQTGSKAFSAAAKKDPALLPLAIIIGGAVTTAAYFFSSRWTGPTAESKFAAVSNPWDHGSKSESQLYKYRYMRNDGKIEHAQPATSYEVVPTAGSLSKLRNFSQKHHTTDKE